ncbi:MAG: META domain-containing protein [Chloroflexi bacterium]|nr:META domain-containing protein [Chloroflexota bacterium]
MMIAKLGFSWSVIGVLVLLVGVACTSSGEPDPNNQYPDLSNTSWQLHSLDGSSPIDGSMTTLLFENETLSGTSGCNSYGGRFNQPGDDDLVIEELAYTEMACLDPDGIMEQEQRFLEILSAATGYVVSEGQLSIYADSGFLLFNPAE